MKKLLVTTLLVMGCGGSETSSWTPTRNVQTCTVNQSNGIATIICPNGTITINQLTIQPFCPNRTGAYYSNSSYGQMGFLENYIQIGSLDYAIMDTGSATGNYLTQVFPGTYLTSDQSGCNFTVNSDGSIVVNN